MPGTTSTRLPAVLLGLALSGCGGPAADELLDTAKLEELQHNPAHARALYEEVIRRYPGTPQAERATARVRALAEGE
jgi:TolA-binding protein